MNIFRRRDLAGELCVAFPSAVVGRMTEAEEKGRPAGGSLYAGTYVSALFCRKSHGPYSALRKSRQNIILRGSLPRNENSRRKHVEIYR